MRFAVVCDGQRLRRRTRPGEVGPPPRRTGAYFGEGRRRRRTPTTRTETPRRGAENVEEDAEASGERGGAGTDASGRHFYAKDEYDVDEEKEVREGEALLFFSVFFRSPSCSHPTVAGSAIPYLRYYSLFQSRRRGMTQASTSLSLTSGENVDLKETHGGFSLPLIMPSFFLSHTSRRHVRPTPRAPDSACTSHALRFARTDMSEEAREEEDFLIFCFSVWAAAARRGRGCRRRGAG